MDKDNAFSCFPQSNAYFSNPIVDNLTQDMPTAIPHKRQPDLPQNDMPFLFDSPKKPYLQTYKKQDTAHPKINLLRTKNQSQANDFSPSGEKNTNLRRMIKRYNTSVCHILNLRKSKLTKKGYPPAGILLLYLSPTQESNRFRTLRSSGYGGKE